VGAHVGAAQAALHLAVPGNERCVARRGRSTGRVWVPPRVRSHNGDVDGDSCGGWLARGEDDDVRDDVVAGVRDREPHVRDQAFRGHTGCSGRDGVELRCCCERCWLSRSSGS